MSASEELLTIRASSMADWRSIARRLLITGRAPEAIHWIDAQSESNRQQGGLFDAPDDATLGAIEDSAVSSETPFRVPKPFLEMAQRVACHRSPQRWELLYRILWRLTGGDRKLLHNLTDPDVRAASAMEKAIRRDAHKMKAFVRFRKVVSLDARGDESEHYIAWHRPDHYIVELTAPFFARRFDVMRWTIMTPDQSAVWDGNELKFGPGMPRSAAPDGDELEELWKTYYANIFNPARIKLKAMQSEMPKKHWATMPETALIDDMLRDAPRRVDEMIRHAEGGVTARAFLPTTLQTNEPAAALQQLRDAASMCQGCDLHGPATQTVFGRGNPNAQMVIIGEQPGDQEDQAGEPFVGPAGRLLNEVMDEVGLDRDDLYITNAVKHFKFKPTASGRLHVKPAAREIAACRPWLETEIDTIHPAMIVCLGVTAADVVFGPGYRLTKQRGTVGKTDFAQWTMATYHPSAILRVPDPDARARMREIFQADLQAAADHWRMIIDRGQQGLAQ